VRWRRWLKILGGLIALYLLGTVAGAWLMTHPPGSSDPAAIVEPFGTGVEVRELRLRGSLELAAWYRPARDGATGAVLLLHGYKESRLTMRGLATVLAARTPYALLVPDFRGCGNSESAPSSAGILERNDVARMLDFLAQAGHPADRTAVIGFSMGAVAALQATVEWPVAGLVVLSPYTGLERAVDLRTRHFSGLPARPLFVPAMWCIGWICGDDVFAADILAAARNSRARGRLVLSEDDDWRAPLPDARRIAEAWGAPLEVYPGADHLILWGDHATAVRERCIRAVEGWLSR
jgi:pimeloyl-ACP methyl ester carboxylesterase